MAALLRLKAADGRSPANRGLLRMRPRERSEAKRKEERIV
jgi:hypothetical protein